jgi:hypothetical protein
VSAWTWAWLAWGAWFVVWEATALANRRPGDTLSEHVWRWLRVRDARPTVMTVIGRGALAAGLGWLLGHLVMGWWS